MAVYLVHQVGSFYFKFGYAKKPRRRLQTLQIGNPQKLELVCAVTDPATRDLPEDEDRERWVPMSSDKLSDTKDPNCHQCGETMRMVDNEGASLPWFWRPRSTAEPRKSSRTKPYSLCHDCVPGDLVQVPGDAMNRAAVVESVEREWERRLLEYTQEGEVRGEWRRLCPSEVLSLIYHWAELDAFVIRPSGWWGHHPEGFPRPASREYAQLFGGQPDESLEAAS